VVLVEVLSPSTEEYDRGEKLAHYERLESLREVLLVAHDQHRVDLVRRTASGEWQTIAAGPGESLTLESIGCRIPVDAVYRDPLPSA
jgi:Uma2 family endonuclease